MADLQGQPALGPQPNFQNLTHHMQGVAHKLTMVPNMPAVGQGEQILQLLQQIRHDIARLDEGMTRLDEGMRGMRADMSRRYVL